METSVVKVCSLLATGLLAAGCGGQVGDAQRQDGGGTADASATVVDAASSEASGAIDAASLSCGLSSGSGPRVPMNHRPASTGCPMNRGPSIPTSPCHAWPDAGVCPLGSCGADSECTQGLQGRCVSGGGGLHQCSYDQCYGDSDCPAGVPCACRTSTSSTEANVCQATSGCAVDSDCGPGGYCSPSLVGQNCSCPSSGLCGDAAPPVCVEDGLPIPCACGDACGHGYYCHTARDECVDDCDCAEGATCNFDVLQQRWSCYGCLYVP